MLQIRPLLYEEKSLDDFNIDSENSIFKFFFDLLLTMEGTKVTDMNVEKNITGMFNDACFICTVALLIKRPAMRLGEFRSWCNEKEFKGTYYATNEARADVVLCMVYFLLKYCGDRNTSTDQLMSIIDTNLRERSRDSYNRYERFFNACDSFQGKVSSVYYQQRRITRQMLEIVDFNWWNFDASWSGLLNWWSRPQERNLIIDFIEEKFDNGECPDPWNIEGVKQSLESLRLPEEIAKEAEEPKEEKWRKTNMFSNDPKLYGNQVPFLLYDEDYLTIIDRTAKAVNEGKVNPFTTNWMEVTLYETEFVRQLLEHISSEFIMDVAEAIDDEDATHQREDGQITVISSEQYGTGQKSSFRYSYSRDNWSSNDNYLSAKSIAEGILEKRKKAEAFLKKLDQRNGKTTILSEDNTSAVIPPFNADAEMFEEQIVKLKAEVNQLAREKATLEKSNRELQEMVNLCKSNIVIADDRKIDVIKVLHAMCKAELFKMKDGSRFTIKAVMEFFGEILNDNFSEYSSNLSTSKSTAKEDTFLEIFDKLRDEAKKYLNKS